MPFRTLVTDRELALMKACNTVFPGAKRLLCRWHINQSVMRNCRPTITSNCAWGSFFDAWVTLIASESDEFYLSNFAQLEAVLLSYPAVLGYLNDIWLIPYTEMFVSIWTDKFLYFGNRTSNISTFQVENLLGFYTTLLTFTSKIHQLVQSQNTEIKASISESRRVIKHRHRIHHFKQLLVFVSIHALDIIFKEYQHAQFVGLFSGNCNCLLRTSYGLPCGHEQMSYSKKVIISQLIRLMKLDLSSCQSFKDDDIDCEDEVKNFTEEFKKQSRPEPAVNKTTRGCPLLKDKLSRKPYVDPPFTAHGEPSFTTQGPLRRSASNASTFVGFDKMSNQDPARHSFFTGKNYNVHPYVNQFPEMFHLYITGDENCGFRAIAVSLGLHEDAWPTIRFQLMEDLNTYKTEYLAMFGSEDCNTTYNNFFRIAQAAPYDHWFTMPEIPVLMACKYNVILHVIAMAGSLTYLPLRSAPSAWYQHVVYTIGFVNGNHYAKLVFTEGYPLPTITSHSSISVIRVLLDGLPRIQIEYRSTLVFYVLIVLPIMGYDQSRSQRGTEKVDGRDVELSLSNWSNRNNCVFAKAIGRVEEHIFYYQPKTFEWVMARDKEFEGGMGNMAH
ncbi:LOW QUALITY PROTEIN: hypothetical protein OSB04_006205 [Centaurea solstitialis]|uniref:OTU domain-containing protein n=1 Tax=Centaurea solstitialis TaxID=347529 RepID=A0AA38THH6_9ASTR|nr:LOW QUALITY PROTEIN: hypothetical protein OSB04_006205 [Centaurea solstitialis]